MVSQLEIYFNTTNLRGEELKERRIKAGTQDAMVLDFFIANHTGAFTPYKVWKHFTDMGKTYPEGSIRRAITTLTKEGYLECTNIREKGRWGSDNYCWKLKSK